VADGDTAVAVAAGMLILGLKKASLRSDLGELRIIDD